MVKKITCGLKKGIEKYEVGDCLLFFTEPYRYIKTGNGKKIDFGLRNLTGIKKIKKYKLPFDEEIIAQSINDILCESCILNEQCQGVCIRSKKELELLREGMLENINFTNID